MSPGCGTEVEWKTLTRHEAVKLYKTSRYPWIQDQDDLKSIFETLNFSTLAALSPIVAHNKAIHIQQFSAWRFFESKYSKTLKPFVIPSILTMWSTKNSQLVNLVSKIKCFLEGLTLQNLKSTFSRSKITSHALFEWCSTLPIVHHSSHWNLITIFATIPITT